MNIAIIGGGIAGLALALDLHQRGIGCTIFEAAPELREIGVGITLLPHAMREITALGLEDAVKSAGIDNEASAFFNRFGQQIYVEPRGRHAGYPYPEIGIHRGKLHGILYRAVLDRLGPDSIRTDHQFVGHEQDDQGVTLHFQRLSDGTPLPDVTAAIVIACDGVNSTMRKAFYPDEQVAFTGINTWRGVTRRPPILGGRTYMRIGSLRTGKMVIYPIADNDDGTQLINWVAEIQRPGEAQNDWNRPGDVADFLPIFEDFRFDWLDVRQLILDAEMVLEYPMVDKNPVDRWTFGRVTLAGDAAHPMYPRGSNGSAQALIDARVLADLLATQTPLDALSAFEAVRLPATAELVRTNRTSPPDFINIRVEELVGDRPFANLDDHISQDELRALSDHYKSIAGFSRSEMNE